MEEKDLNKVLNAKADNSQNEQKESKKKEVAKGNVTVCCAFPMGLKLVLHNGKEVILQGTPMSHIVSAYKGQGFLPAGKYGTTVLSADVWEEIQAKYKGYEFLKNGAVFAEAQYESAVSKAKEKSENKLGFEQADPKKGGRTKKKSED